MYKFLLTYFMIFAISGTAQALFEHKVVSGSKRDIAVMTFQGKCDAKKGGLEKMSDAWKKAKKKDQDFLSSLKGALSAGADPGCQKSLDITLKPGGSADVSPGQLVVAFKTSGNPFPAICKVQEGKTINLVTRKSEKLRSFLGIAGDFGLMCEYK